MDEIPEQVEYKLGILNRSLDFVSDYEASKHLGVSRATIQKYRKQLGGSTLVEAVDRLDQRAGRRPRGRVCRDPKVLAKWIKSENEDWSDLHIASAMRDLGHRELTAKMARHLLDSKTDEKLARQLNKPIPIPKDLGETWLNFVTEHPIRALAMYSRMAMGEVKVLLGMLEVAENLGVVEEELVARTLSQAKKDTKKARAAMKLARSLQGKGITLRDVPKAELLETRRRNLLMRRE